MSLAERAENLSPYTQPMAFAELAAKNEGVVLMVLASDLPKRALHETVLDGINSLDVHAVKAMINDYAEGPERKELLARFKSLRQSEPVPSPPLEPKLIEPPTTKRQTRRESSIILHPTVEEIQAAVFANNDQVYDLAALTELVSPKPITPDIANRIGEVFAQNGHALTTSATDTDAIGTICAAVQQGYRHALHNYFRPGSNRFPILKRLVSDWIEKTPEATSEISIVCHMVLSCESIQAAIASASSLKQLDEVVGLVREKLPRLAKTDVFPSHESYAGWLPFISEAMNLGLEEMDGVIRHKHNVRTLTKEGHPDPANADDRTAWFHVHSQPDPSS